MVAGHIPLTSRDGDCTVSYAPALSRAARGVSLRLVGTRGTGHLLKSFFDEQTCTRGRR